MATHSCEWNKIIPSIGTVTGIADSVLGELGYMPRLFAVIILILAAIMTIPFLWKNIRQKWKRVLTTTLCSVAFVGFAIYFWNKREPDKSEASRQEITNSNNTTITTNQSSGSIKDVNANDHSQAGNGNTQITVAAPIEADLVQIGNGNKLTVKNYNLPQQRHLNSTDLRKLRLIEKSTQRIDVMFPQNNHEAERYAVEIKNKLFDLGYKSVGFGHGTSLIGSKDRFSVSPLNDQEHSITLFVNPQF